MANLRVDKITSTETFETTGSVQFDGTGDYLSLADNADFAFGTGDFTVECFIYPTANASYQAIIDCRDATTQATGWILGVDVNDNIYIYNDGYLLQSGSGITPENRWFHVAYVRNSGVHALYVDGRSVATSSSSYNYTVDNCVIGASYAKNSEYWDGFISNLRINKGTALYTANFTPPTRELTNVTNTKLLCCQSNTSAIAAAVSPGTITANGNAAATNFNPFNTDINIVRGQETGYCTWNPLVVTSNNSLSNGNLTASHTASTGWTGGVWSANSATIVANTGVSSGSWYWEVHIDSESSPGYTAVGITTRPVGGPYYVGYADNGIAYTSTYIYQDSAYGSGAGSLPTTASGDTIGVALDMDNGHIWFSKNGSYVYGNPYTRTGSQSSNIIGTMYPAVSQTGSNTGFTAAANFGQKPFKFPPPAGFQPLNAANVRPETVITRPDQYVGVTTYTGNGGTQSIETGHKFDFVWIKTRSGSGNHHLFDVVRGVNKSLHSDNTDDTETTTAGLTSFDSNGFSIGNSNNDINGNDITFVSWNWKAGGNKNTFNVDDVGYASTTAAGLTAGANANLVTGSSVGTKQGFSIIKFNASAQSSAAVQLPHGLSQSPSFLIVKSLDSNSTNWYTWHQNLTNTAQNRLFLNGDNAQDGNTSIWNNTAPSSTTFSVGGDPHNNDNCITYLWHDVPGLQKFGKYDGNNSADGPFIELGFRPALFVMKQLTSTGYWMVYDSARDPVNNGSPYYLFWNTSAAHGTGYDLDFLSNGVKLRTNNANFNASTPYVYMAWAEAPTFNLYGAQSNAR